MELDGDRGARRPRRGRVAVQPLAEYERAGESSPLPATAVRVILRRNRSYPEGYAVLTAYPVLAAPYPRHP